MSWMPARRDLPVVVIGGGVSGRAVARVLHDKDPTCGVVTLDQAVRAIDPDAPAAILDGGYLPASALVLATGASIMTPDVAGREHIIEPRALCSQTAPGATAVIGAGLTGHRLARCFAEHGRVHLIDPRTDPLIDRLGSGMADRAATTVAQAGVQRHRARVLAVVPMGGRFEVHLDGGAGLLVDRVIAATGWRPNSQLASAAGLACSADGGIVVDEHLETSSPRIHAVGAVAESLWPRGTTDWARASGDFLGLELAGHQAPALDPPDWTLDLGVDRIHVIGDLRTADRLIERAEVTFGVRGRHVVGVALAAAADSRRTVRTLRRLLQRPRLLDLDRLADPLVHPADITRR